MTGNSLPAQMQRVLQNHLAQQDLAKDEELEGIIERLSELTEAVEQVKMKIIENRNARKETA